MDLIGQKISLVCPEVQLGRFFKIRVKEICNLDEKLYHSDRWQRRALRSTIFEQNGHLVSSRDQTKETNVIFVVDLEMCTVLTCFRFKKGLKFLKGSLVL